MWSKKKNILVTVNIFATCLSAGKSVGFDFQEGNCPVRTITPSPDSNIGLCYRSPDCQTTGILLDQETLCKSSNRVDVLGLHPQYRWEKFDCVSIQLSAAQLYRSPQSRKRRWWLLLVLLEVARMEEKRWRWCDYAGTSASANCTAAGVK